PPSILVPRLLPSTFYLLPPASCLLPPTSYLLPPASRSARVLARALGFFLHRLLEDPQRRVAAGGAHDAAAGVRRPAAHIKAADACLVLRPAGSGMEEEELLQRQLSLEDVAFRETEGPLD